ncbi:ABC transporter permease [Desulfocurvibacter africanus]|uniref:ABC-2 type transporter n=1 Tax=Desulfocurvibacter africanus subsp. africanus str. Walvis Bay TaxID=690850 RepID=F3YV08_DESAF|nr:ABC transporter permease [Desulfocurvibacter africanus]EGJ49258.1 ABC-2 type transporter [Desulfocurvibacter africanus subsp. africanus str. Walvis Bay]
MLGIPERALRNGMVLPPVTERPRTQGRSGLDRWTMLTLYGWWSLVFYRVFADLASEVRRYYISYLWWVFEPVLNMAVLYLVFGIFMNRDTPNFVQFLLVGVSVWKWFGSTVANGSNSIINSKGIVLQAYLPKSFFPMVVALTDYFKFLIVLGLLLLFLWATGFPPTRAYLALPALMAAQFLVCYGLAAVLAAVVPFVPDMRFLVATALQVGFFVSGIFFDIRTVLLPKHMLVFHLNPMATLIAGYRSVLIEGAWPDAQALAFAAAVGLVLCLVAALLLARLDRVYPRIL